MTTDDANDIEVSDTEHGSTEEPKDRDISELISLGTYQGMTDGEIQKVIDWYVNLAHMDSETNAYRAAAQSMSESHEQAVAAILSDSENVLKSIVSSTTSYQTVEPQAVTDLLVEKGEV